jgi:hypothetical protein
MSLNKILSSTKYVTDNAKYVSIDYDKVDSFCSTFKKEKVEPFSSLLPMELSLNKEEKIRFMFMQVAANFCFWGTPKWEYYYNGKTYYGSIAMVIALYVAIEDNKKLLDADTLINLNIDDIKKIFPMDRNNQYIPLIEVRLANLNDVGLGFKLIEKDYNCSLSEIIDKFNDEEDLFDFVIKYFKSFNNDVTTYKGEKIYIYKRNQLLISDMNAMVYSGNKFNLNKLTVFADYRIPQLMRDLGFIKYNDELSYIVDNEIEIKKDDEMEIEIRSSIIQVGHYMVNKLKEKGINVNDAYIDNYMFLYMKNNKNVNVKPHHRVRTINY